jgi:hypothetical protein
MPGETTLSAHHDRHHEFDICQVSTRRWILVTTLMDTRSENDVMDLLRQGIPLTLLLDLVDPLGPHSDDLLAHERPAA